MSVNDIFRCTCNRREVPATDPQTAANNERLSNLAARTLTLGPFGDGVERHIPKEALEETVHKIFLNANVEGMSWSTIIRDAFASHARLVFATREEAEVFKKIFSSVSPVHSPLTEENNPVMWCNWALTPPQAC